MNKHIRFERPALYRKCGYLLFDADTVFKLSAVIPGEMEMRERKTRHLWDIARHLGRIHFKAVITEIAAYVTAGTLRDGSVIYHQPKSLRPNPLIVKRHDLLRAGHNSENISIIAPSQYDDSDAARFINTIFDIHTSSDSGKVGRLIEARKSMSSDFTIEAARQFIHMKNTLGEAIFIVSDSSRTHERLRNVQNKRGAPVHLLTMKDFLAGAEHAGIFEDVRLKVNGAQDLVLAITEYSSKHNLNIHMLDSLTADHEANRNAFAKAIIANKRERAQIQMMRQQFPIAEARL